MSRVLITGGAGFIGLHLARALVRSGTEVHLLDNFARGVADQELQVMNRQPGVRLIEQDLLKRGAFADLGTGYEAIYHLAAIIGVASVLGRPYAVLADNVSMLAGVIEFARKQKELRRLVFASTSEVYAGTLQHFQLPIPTPESTPLALTDLDQPRTSYMLSKIYGEAMCRQSGLPFTIVRPHNVYGPRMGLAHVIPELFKKAQEASAGEEIEVSSVNHRRAFCYIDDAVEMIGRAGEQDSCRGQTLNIGNSDLELPMGELGERIFRLAGKGQKVKAGQETPGSPCRRCPDMTQTSRLTGFRAQVSLDQGLERTFAWYRKRVFSGEEISAR